MPPLRILELFCGIGGLAEAVGSRGQVIAAVDINRQALNVYRHNFAHLVHCRTIESVPVESFDEHAADLWWLSPPCQPFTRRGRMRDLDDPRCAGLVNVIERIGQVRPRYVALENVPEFEGSRAHRRMRAMLDRCGYKVCEAVVCPTELGVANRRRRFYLVAANGETARLASGGLRPPLAGTPLVHSDTRLGDFLQSPADPALLVSEGFVRQFAAAMHVVEEDDPHGVASCFTSAYGRSPVHCGSYLRIKGGRVRRFSPREILRLLGFGEKFTLPADLPRDEAWPLVGNSLSVATVRHVLSAVPELQDLGERKTVASHAAEA